MYDIISLYEAENILLHDTLQIAAIFERRGKIYCMRIRRLLWRDIWLLSITFVLVDAGLFLLQTTNISFRSDGKTAAHMRQLI